MKVHGSVGTRLARAAGSYVVPLAVLAAPAAPAQVAPGSPVNVAAVSTSAPSPVGAAGATFPAAAPAAEYRIAAGDALRVIVFQNPDLSLEVRVTDTGSFSYPLLGPVAAAGRTVGEIERAIAEGLSSGSFVKQPQVTVVVLQVRGNQVNVLGQVNRPGRYPLEQAETRLTDLLATAGGTSPSGADLAIVTGVRNGRPFRAEIDVPALFQPGGHLHDLHLQNGDQVWIDRQPLVYIHGEVQRPGPMRLERGMTLMQALATGGGLTARGTERGIRVHRRAADGRVQVIELGLTGELQNGDVVQVRESLF